ncbi:MAG TPA: SMI1/KNR4 family protein [Actinoplanes sp.]|nr:SMI1/KNR4 family protein [Actinoplanes sp.]
MPEPAFDLASELTTALTDSTAADRSGVWQFVHRFAAAWHLPLASDDGCTDAELDAAEARLGASLPAALREAYRLFGRRSDLTSNEDVLLAPEDLFLDPGGQALVFRVQSHALAFWGVRVADLGEADPPVAFTLNLADRSAGSWHGWLDSVSSACVEMVLSESLYGEDAVQHALVDKREQTPADGDLLAATLTRVPLPEYPTSGAFGPGVRWFAGDELLARDDARTWLTIRTATPAALTTARRSLPGPWST